MLSLGKNLKESLMILFCPGIKHFSYAWRNAFKSNCSVLMYRLLRDVSPIIAHFWLKGLVIKS
jgi:hypothetical protein